MKKLLVTLLLLWSADAMAQGIRFFKGSWQQVLAESRKTGKPVFVDVYTSWCVPCKRMEKEIFPLAKVGAKFNKNFINYRIDAEKGDGIALRKQYTVNAFPTYLFINPDGILIYRNLAYDKDPAVFMKHADAAMGRFQEKITVVDMKQSFIDGNRDTAFLQKFIGELRQLEMDSLLSAALDAYVDTLNEQALLQPERMRFLYEHVIRVDNKAFDFMMTHQQEFARTIPLSAEAAPEVMLKMQNWQMMNALTDVVSESLTAANVRKDSLLYKRAQEAVTNLPDAPLRSRLNNYFAGSWYYAGIKDTVTQLQRARDFMSRPEFYDSLQIKAMNDSSYAESMFRYEHGFMDSTVFKDFEGRKKLMRQGVSRQVANYMHYYADKVAYLSSEKSDYELALRAMEQAIRIDGVSSLYLRTMALLYLKNGQKEKAVEVMKQLNVNDPNPQEAKLNREITEMQR